VPRHISSQFLKALFIESLSRIIGRLYKTGNWKVAILIAVADE
jgi:hypothetical protein